MAKAVVRKRSRGVVVDRKRKLLVLHSGRKILLQPYHMPLTKRFPLGLTDKAYRALRKLALETGIGNNYTLTVLLENAENTINRRAFRRAVDRLKAALGGPAGPKGR